MKELKKYAKYVLWLVLFYFLTNFLIFVGFNANYKSINVKEVPSQVKIQKAEATKSQVRVYGTVKNQDNLNGKFIKLSVYNADNEEIATEHLKIENLKSDEEKNFRFTSTANGVTSCEVNIVDNK